MTLKIAHAFVSPKADGTDPTLVKPSDWNNSHNITTDQTTGVLAGRASGSAGALTDIPAPFNADGSLALVPALAARFKPTADWTWGYTGGQIPVPFATTEFNQNAGTFAGSGGPSGGHKWTPGAGIWHFDIQVWVNNAEFVVTSYAMYLIKNGTTDLGAWAGTSPGLPSPGDVMSPRISCLAQLTSSDYLQVQFAIGGSQPGGYNFTAANSFFAGNRVG